MLPEMDCWKERNQTPQFGIDLVNQHVVSRSERIPDTRCGGGRVAITQLTDGNFLKTVNANKTASDIQNICSKLFRLTHAIIEVIGSEVNDSPVSLGRGYPGSRVGGKLSRAPPFPMTDNEIVSGSSPPLLIARARQKRSKHVAKLSPIYTIPAGSDWGQVPPANIGDPIFGIETEKNALRTRDLLVSLRIV